MKQVTPPQGSTDRRPEGRPPARILIVGGGYVGMYAALRLQRRLHRGEAEITVVDPQPYMTYQPFLPEAAAGSIDPRHVVVPLRQVLRGCTVVTGEITSLDHRARRAWAATAATRSTGAPDLDLPYDLLVVAPGSVSRTLPIPGLADHGIGFKTVEEAVALRNHVLEQLDIASSTRDPAIRQAALTFVFVGGGYAGVEALAELEDMARYATRYYHNLTADDLRWVLVEAADRILPEVGPELGRYTVSELRGRNVEVRLNTRLESAADRIVALSDGSRFAARTLVWTAGVRPAPVLADSDLPRDSRGRVRCAPTLEVAGTEGVWSAGDCAAVPDLARPGEYCTPNAQHAVRQGKVLGDNVLARLRGEPQTPYQHRHAGAVASLGLHKGVAQVRGRRLTGRPAWLLHRAYHLNRLPTLNRKARVLADWVLAGLSTREIVSLGSLEHPRAEFEAAMDGGPTPPPREVDPRG
ncbi:NAD(P)/FAD-dependent oxidoreductase [Streptomyces sp. NPDC092296]|uniref:NAD(P)/FAD-dependent oxidoreductase n=1 Tax=Streptomyces sp. NPDC092296 TaxID=3366012 RepID=UPI00382A4A3E